MKRMLVWLGVLGAGAFLVPAAASAQDGSRQEATLTFTSSQPGRSSGLVLSIDYVNPSDPAAKPPAVRKVVTEIAPGARYDTGAPGLCTATDPELIAEGASACPADSVVGEGVITIDTGVPGPNRIVASDTTFLNDTDELIFLNTERQTGGRLVVRGAVGERTITTESPPLPGTPPDGGAIDTVFITEPPLSSEVDGATRHYVSTPPECPADLRYWVNRVHFTYFDGATQVVETRSPCDPPGAAGPASCRGRAATIVASPGRITSGTPGTDVIVGSSARETIKSGAGDDLICARGGRDALVSGDGNDSLKGGAGADRLRGGPGHDDCAGGRGRDREVGCER